MNITETDEQIL